MKSGGKMIIDVPTEDKSLQYLITFEMKDVLGLPSELDRSWVKGAHSLWDLFEEVGLTVEHSYRTRDYAEALETNVYDGSEGEKVWEQQMEKLKDFLHLEEDRREEAKQTFLKTWEKSLGPDCRFRDGRWLYVVVGKK